MHRTVALFLALLVVSPAVADETAVKSITVPFDLLITKHIVVQIKINGKGPYPVIFDTGAPVTLINTRTAKESGMLGKDTIRSGFSLFGPAAQTKIRTLNLGELQATGVPAIVMDHPTVELVSKLLRDVRGIVGFPFFARYAMTLDYQAKKMTFTPNKYEPKDIIETLMATLMDREKPAARILAASGVWGIEVGKQPGDEDAGVVVMKVLPRSAAEEAGLRVGDRILTLDDFWTDTIDDCYGAAGQVSPGSAVQVQVKRGAAEITVEVKPTNGL
jgi:hypothetical protein